jgi:putative nucleotidyltransferase with HDIG domain
MKPIEEYLCQIKALPVLPEMANRILRLAETPNVSIKEIADEIQKDPAITLRILKVINSSFYAMRREVTSVQQAVTLLGIQQVRNLVVTLLVVNRFHEPPNALYTLASFWNHSLGVALVSQILSKKLGFAGQSDLYLAGLLHDIGKIIFQVYFPDELTKAKEYIDAQHCDMYQAEQDVFGFTHAELGAWVAKEWNLPKVLQLGIQYHHDALASPDPLFSSLLQVADQITKARLFAVYGDQNVDLVFEDEPCWKYVFDTYQVDLDIERFLLEMDDEIEKARELVSTAMEP